MAAAPPPSTDLKDVVVQALGRLPSTLPSPESTKELKRALDDLASIRTALNNPTFPGLPKPPSDEDSLAPLPLVTMISAPQLKKRKEQPEKEEKEGDQVVEIKMEEVVKVKEEKKVDEEDGEGKEGEMQVD